MCARRDIKRSLITTTAWPPNEWPFGPIRNLNGRTPTLFADALDKLKAKLDCDVLMSLERVWSCDVYRAGDGVHRAWLRRRAEHDGTFEKIKGVFNRKHRGILRLEESLFGHGGARRVIANSEMVKGEIVKLYGYPAEEVNVIPNGVPVALFASAKEKRDASRHSLGISGR